MTNRTKTQNGFSTITIAVALILVLVIAGIGFTVFNRSSDTKTAIAPTEGAPNSQQPIDQQPAAPERPVTTYLEIKEWGVKLPLSDAIKDAYYVVPNGISKNADGRPSGIIIGITSLNDSCGIVTSRSEDFQKAFAEIVRTLPTNKYPTSGKAYTEQFPIGVTIDGYYYGYAKFLYEKLCEPQDKLQAIDDALANATKGTTHQ